MAEPSAPVVIFNPAAGRGYSAKQAKLLQPLLPPGAVIIATDAPATATAIAADAARRGSKWIIAAGGDGTTHEVASGILGTGIDDVLFTPLPFGSMNDFAYTLGLHQWWQGDRDWSRLQTLKSDIGIIRGGGREQFFVNCCGIGFNGMVTIEARKIRSLRGVPLYVVAVLKALVRHYRHPAFIVEINGFRSERPTLAMTLGIGQREGGFPLTQAARLDDGEFDLVQVGDISRWQLIRYLPAMISGNLPNDNPKVIQTKGRSLRLQSTEPLCIHTDGEFFCTPDHKIQAIEVELIPSRMFVSCFPEGLYGGAAAMAAPASG